MREYVGTKRLKATPMKRGTYNALREWENPKDENPGDDGYLVEYLDSGKPNHPDFDGYISWSPADVFEKSYRPVAGLTLGMAIEAAKNGAKITRTGWNGKNMFVVYQKGYPEGIPCNKNTAEAFGLQEGDLFKVRPYLQMRCADGTHQMWLASQSDLLADDWMIL